MNKTTVKFKKLDERAQMPHYGTEFAAGADLYACLDAPLTIAKEQRNLSILGLRWKFLQDLSDLCMQEAGWRVKKDWHRPIKLVWWIPITAARLW